MKSQAPTCIIVAGMHRSGTSATTRVINLLGADIASNLVAGIPGDNDVAATHLNVGGIKLPLNTSCNPPAAAAIDIVMYDSAGNPIAFQEYFLP